MKINKYISFNEDNNVTEQRVKGQYHNDAGPAVVTKYGWEYYFKHGVIHRTDGPAVIGNDDNVQYWVNGQLHRTDGPAVIGIMTESTNYGIEYWVDGKRHREDGPAVIDNDGNAQYWVNGQLHRTDGPAVIGKPVIFNRDRKGGYWMYGYFVTHNYQHKTDPESYYKYNREYWVEGVRHREDGPAIIASTSADITDTTAESIVQTYYINGKMHREDGPAVIDIRRSDDMFEDPLQAYYINGELHREDGPAEIYSDGEIYYKNGLRHREDGPAEIFPCGIMYLIDGKMHRTDGPAFIACENGIPTGKVEYWVNDNRITEHDFMFFIKKEKLQAK